MAATTQTERGKADVLVMPQAPALEESLKNFDPRWRTSDVVDLARGILEGRAFSKLGLLSDALMDAGCENEAIIDACRSGNLREQVLLLRTIVLEMPQAPSLEKSLENFDPRWRTSDVTDLALGVVNGRALDRMPILADGLMDAGCENEAVIAACKFGNLREQVLLLSTITKRDIPSLLTDLFKAEITPGVSSPQIKYTTYQDMNWFEAIKSLHELCKDKILKRERPAIDSEYLTKLEGNKNVNRVEEAPQMYSIIGFVPESLNKTRDEQIAHLGNQKPPLEMPSLEAAIFAHVLHYAISGDDLFNDSWVRVRGASLYFYGDGLYDYEWHDSDAYGRIGCAGCPALPRK